MAGSRKSSSGGAAAGFKAGQPAPSTVYEVTLDENGQRLDSPSLSFNVPTGQGGTVLVQQGDVVTAAQADRIKKG